MRLCIPIVMLIIIACWVISGRDSAQIERLDQPPAVAAILAHLCAQDAAAARQPNLAPATMPTTAPVEPGAQEDP